MRAKAAHIQALNDFWYYVRDERKRREGKITLPTVSIQKDRIFRGQKRRHVVNEVMDVLRNWRFTPFENEASTVHGLRSALCLEGHSWHLANNEAHALVAEGLRLLGAHRPTWDQGQREYSVAPDYCNWCHSPMSEDAGGKRFCSVVCAKSAITWRDYETTYKDSVTGNAAYYIIRRSQQPTRPCKKCGAPFHPDSPGSTQKFCSKKCAGTYGPPIAERVCLQCGSTFRPPSNRNTGRFCSHACYHTHGRTERYECTCAWCGKPFIGKSK